MNAERLENMIRDRSVPDGEVLRGVREYLAAREIVPACEIDEVERIGVLTETLRPEVFGILRKEVAAAHSGCCCPAAVTEASR